MQDGKNTAADDSVHVQGRVSSAVATGANHEVQSIAADDIDGKVITVAQKVYTSGENLDYATEKLNHDENDAKPSNIQAQNDGTDPQQFDNDSLNSTDGEPNAQNLNGDVISCKNNIPPIQGNFSYRQKQC